MAVTSQCKIALRPGSIFCFGIILSVADEKGILHRIADPQEKKLSLEIPRKARTRQRTAQPPVPQAKTTSCKPRTGNVLARRTLLPTSPTKEWTRITRKREASVPRKGTELRRVIFPSPSPSKKDGKELATTVTPFYPSSSGGGGGDWSRLPSPTTNRLCKGKSLPSEKLGDEGTDAGIFGDITRLGNRTQRSPYLEMKFQRQEKPPMSEHTEKGGILAAMIDNKLRIEIKNKLSMAQGYAERILSFPKPEP
jgi:hypothetical protein